MRLYRFGIRFKSKAELAAVLGVPPYSGLPLVQKANDRRTYGAYLSEKDIINRLTKLGGYDSEEKALEAFKALVQQYRANEA